MIALYHRVTPEDTFEVAAQMLFDLVLKAEAEFPGKPRSLYLDVDGHRNDAGGFDPDMFELLKDFLLGYLVQYLSEVRTPLYRATNPKQVDDLPEDLVIATA
jgi:hypothetical protein